MDKVVCKCGYHGDDMVIFESEKPHRQLVEWRYYNYYKVLHSLNDFEKTLNWCCPQCGAVLVQQKGGMDYRMENMEKMSMRLSTNSYKNSRYLHEIGFDF